MSKIYSTMHTISNCLFLIASLVALIGSAITNDLTYIFLAVFIVGIVNLSKIAYELRRLNLK
jgi:hypothetical protein